MYCIPFTACKYVKVYLGVNILVAVMRRFVGCATRKKIAACIFTYC